MAADSVTPTGPFSEGEIILLDDVVTGFDDNKKGRRYCVVRVVGDPLQLVLVVPRTTKGKDGTPSKQSDCPTAFTEDGRFLYRPYQVFPADLEGVTRLDVLPPSVIAKIIGNVNFAAIDLELDL